MKKIAFTLFLSFASFFVFSQKTITLNPQVDEQSQDYINITKVELTDDFTIIHFRFQDNGNPFDQLERMFRERFGGGGSARKRESDGNTIEIDPNSRLYEPRNASRKFRFIKAEGIPVAPQTMKTRPGQVVNFKVWYERLTPGIQLFDMFEGRDYDRRTFWNFYGVHIRNPKNLPPKPKPEVKKPEEAPKAEMPAMVEPTVAATSVVSVKGNILDAKTQKPIAAKLSYVTPNDDGSKDSITLSSGAGKFKIALPKGDSYGYTATAKGYFPSNGAFDLSKAEGGSEITKDILLIPIVVGEAITLNNIYFEVTKYDLLPASYSQLDELVKMLQDNPKTEIRVEGHTDSVGDFDENITLSLNRANAVKKYLVGKGIDSARIEAKGYGSTRPATKSSLPQERQKNRRVEFVVLKN